MEIADKIVAQLRDARKAREEAGRAVVAKPAEPKKAVAFKALGCDEFGVIVGIGGAAGSPTHLDLDEEFVSKADLQSMGFEFCAAANRKFKANHQEDIEVQLVASWVGAPIIEVVTKAGDVEEVALRMLAEGETLVNDMNVVGIDIQKGNETHWFVSVRPTDPEIIEIAKAGGVAGFSWSGLVNRVEV